MKVKVWLISWLIIVVSVLSIFGYWVYKIDPFFHYHKPDMDSYFYPLNNQRSQNDGISKHFDYDALITGSSMTENFKSTEMDRIFGCNSIKVSYSGGSYKEINDNIEIALEHNENLKTVVRCLDMSHFLDTYDLMRTELGQYPMYLYDDNPFNDLEYLLNRDVIFGRVYQMTLENDAEGFKPGITSFDDYARWQSKYKFGINTVIPEGITVIETEQSHLSDAEKEMIKKNIEFNVTRIADDYPDVDFYYFYSPYSVVNWNRWKTQGVLHKQLEAEAFITELIVQHNNIHLFSFNNRTDITTDLNNYKDDVHYATWINSLILKWMYEGKYQLTEKNYKEYLSQEYEFYTTYDYESINGQKDYEVDLYAAALLNEELTGVKPLDVLNDEGIDVEIKGAEYVAIDGKNRIVNCYGSLNRDQNLENLEKYIRDEEFIGIKFNVDLGKGYDYLCFDGQKISDNGGVVVLIYDEFGEVIKNIEVNYTHLDNEIHQYVIDLSTISGKITVVLNGGYTDKTGSADSNYQFSNIYVY